MGIVAVFRDGEFAADQAGLGVGDEDAALIGELVGTVDLGGDPLGNRRKRHGKTPCFSENLREV